MVVKQSFAMDIYKGHFGNNFAFVFSPSLTNNTIELTLDNWTAI